MEPSKKPLPKPLLSSQKKISTDPYEKKLSKIDIYYRYTRPNQIPPEFNFSAAENARL